MRIISNVISLFMIVIIIGIITNSNIAAAVSSKIPVSISVLPNPGVTLFTDPTYKTINPSQAAFYSITIINTGKENDTFNIIVDNVNSAQNVNIGESNITLSPWESSAFGLSVSDPDIGKYIVNVAAISSKNSSKRYNLTILTEVVPFPITPSDGSSSGYGPSIPPSGSSGGGNVVVPGGPDIHSQEKPENVLKYETRDNDLIANSPVKFIYTSNIPIYEADVIGTLNEGDVSLRIELLKGMSSLAEPTIPGNVYKHVSAWINSVRIKKVTFKYKVENSWIEDNGVSVDTIKLYKWDKTIKKWRGLATKIIKSDANYTYLESETDSLSPFAITGIGIKNIVPEIVPITSEETIQYPTTTVEFPTITVPEYKPPAELPQKKGPGFDSILIILVISIIIIWRYTRKI